MRFSKLTATLLALSCTSLLLTGCEAEQTEKDMLAEAQYCLDDAQSESEADTCMTKISGLNSERANELRCAAGFYQVASPANLSQALNTMNESGGSSAGVLGVLAFDTRERANTTFEYCQDSGSEGLQLLGAMAKTATILNEYGGVLGSGGDPEAQLAAILQQLSTVPDGQVAEDVGSTIQAVYTASCALTVSNEDMCGSIDEALAQDGTIDINDPADAETIGQLLLEHWNEN
ncbi:hypothetical protein [Bdellovibrio reynosensis]|uniref:Lipoprotein n=1 Tax=Bdellovibrio reynosensis TaxID=2835041 RepID=A0ABY4C7X1_9BACT|nr:hypothetical protein [Bdellovibrio reynosensis]UOF01087.1 hypothetical protein MNR06_15405 [Bdellovibrio reynosensis]